MKKRTQWLGLVLAMAVGAALLSSGPAAALPPNAPKIGMVCSPGIVSGTTHTFNLVANSGLINTPDGNSVFMWSYASQDEGGHFQLPGPVLCVTQGETVVVNLSNTLPEPASIVFPGQDVGVTATGGVPGLMTSEAAAITGTVSYSFSAVSPGTYLYESGSDISKQVEMGLYGALIVRPSIGANFAYDNTTRFDPSREYLLLLSEFDPDLHYAVETNGTYDFNALRIRYFAVNGRDFPDTIQANGSSLLPNQPYGALVRIQPNGPINLYPALIRMINVGALNHPFHPHGNHLRQIAQDGRMLLNPAGTGSASSERYGETIGSGQSEDYLIRWDDQDNWNPNTNPFPYQLPNYRNLTFKDNNTWYSGSPYLGYQGTLPTGTNSQNVCGEWYFPFHSHALNEFTNYDEGFGGMGTLLRVDPLGGCFTFPASTKITLGSLGGGTVAKLAVEGEANGLYSVKSTTTGTRTTDWYGQFGGVPAGSNNLIVTYKGNYTLIPVTQSIYAWNWLTNGWVQISGPTVVNSGLTVATYVAGIPQAPLPGSWASFIGSGANKGQVRVRVLSTSAANFTTGGDFMKLVYNAP